MNRWGPALRRTSTCSSSAHWRGTHAVPPQVGTKRVFAFCPPLANFAQRIYGYVDKAYIPPEEIQRMEARIRPYVK